MVAKLSITRRELYIPRAVKCFGPPEFNDQKFVRLTTRGVIGRARSLLQACRKIANGTRANGKGRATHAMCGGGYRGEIRDRQRGSNLLNSDMGRGNELIEDRADCPHILAEPVAQRRKVERGGCLFQRTQR